MKNCICHSLHCHLSFVIYCIYCIYCIYFFTLKNSFMLLFDFARLSAWRR